MGHKLLLLAIVGLASLYLLHVLAQDYMKIRKPAAKLAKLLLSKRDLDAVNSKVGKSDVEDVKIDWERILNSDPLKCAQSLICQIVAGAEKDNKEVFILNQFLEYAMMIGVPKEIELAHTYGKNAINSYEMCYSSYPYCPYSANIMLKILKIYSYIFGR